MDSRKIKWLLPTCEWLVFLALFMYYCYLHDFSSISSDTTTLVLPARDFLSGNVLLRGWVFGTNNFLFTDLIYFALFDAAGMGTITMVKVIPSLVMAGYMALATWLFFYRDEFVLEGGVLPGVMTFAALLLFLVTPSSTALYTLLNVNSHNVIYPYLLLCMMMVLAYYHRPQKRAGWLIMYVVLCALSAFSDSLTLMVILAPVCAFAFFDALRELWKLRREEWNGLWKSLPVIKPQLMILLASVLAYILSKWIQWGILRAGGFETRGMPVPLADPAKILQRVRGWIGIFFHFYNCSTPKAIGLTSQVGLRHLICTLLMIGILLSVFVNLVRMFRISRVRMILTWCVVVNIASCVLTNVMVILRYIVPTYLLGTTLLLLTIKDALVHFSSTSRRRFPIVLVMGGLLLLAGGIQVKDRLDDILVMDPHGYEQRALLNYLKEHHLKAGYGEFWSSSVLAAYDDFDTDILPVYLVNTFTSDDGTDGKLLLEPYIELVKKDWYEASGERHFIVFRPDFAGFFDSDYILGIIGEPDDIYSFSQYQIWAYKKDLSPYVGRYVEEHP